MFLDDVKHKSLRHFDRVEVRTVGREEAQMRAALSRIAALETVVEKPALIRIENLQ